MATRHPARSPGPIATPREVPGGSLFVMLRMGNILGGVIVLTPGGTLALVPPQYLVAIRGVTPVPPGPTPAGGKG